MVRRASAQVQCMFSLSCFFAWASCQRLAATQEVCEDSAAATAPSLLQVHSAPTERKSEDSDTKTFAPKSPVSPKKTRAPCACQPEGADWKKPEPRPPRCVFIDLGAADGNSFQTFLANGFGPVGNCPSGGSWEAILLEANPHFSDDLKLLQANHSGKLTSIVASAAYMCEGTANFYLDTVDKQQNYWGSSMSDAHPDVQKSGKKNVKVPLVNVARLITESALPEDYVVMKVDIEGSEHDILPCLAQSSAASLLDSIFMEKHPVEWSLSGADATALPKAVAALQSKNVYLPEYFSSTF